MITKLTVINYRGESLELPFSDPLSTGINITDISGIGAPDTDISINDFAASDGGFFSSARSRERTITIDTMPIFSANGDVEYARHKIYKYFPIKKKVTLIFTTTEKDSMIEGYVSALTPDIFNKQETVKIEIKCPDPVFRIYGDSESIIVNGIDPEFEFEFESEMDAPSIVLHHFYSFSVSNSRFIHGKSYRVVLPNFDYELKFASNDSGTIDGEFTGSIVVTTLDQNFQNGTIVIDNVGEYQLELNDGSATDELFYDDPSSGKEIWSAVSVQRDPDGGLVPGNIYYVDISGIGGDQQYKRFYFYYPANLPIFDVYSYACDFIVHNGEIINIGSISCDGRLFDLYDTIGSIPDAPQSANVVELITNENPDIPILNPHLASTDYVPSDIHYTDNGTESEEISGDANKLCLGEISTERSGVVNYIGDCETGFIMQFFASGNVGNFTVYDSSFDGKMEIDTSKIPGGFKDGDMIEISTVSGNKYVRLFRNGIYSNIINALDRNSQWFTLIPGENVFVYSAVSGSDKIKFKVSYKAAYQGV